MKFKKIISAAVGAAMLCASLPFSSTMVDFVKDNVITANAAETGQCGDNVYYSLSDDGVLTISGNGDMTNYGYNESPFCKNASIKSVVIENGVTSIGDYTFYDRTNIENITIPDTITSIGRLAFSGTKWLTNKREENPLVIVNGILIDGKKCKGDIVIPDFVTSICGSAFEVCEDITSITMSDSVTSIGDLAFEYCTNLTSVKISNYITSIGYMAFGNCYKLESITIPNMITSISNMAFYSCNSLTSVVIPESVTLIDDNAFCNCTKLENIIIPDSVKSIGRDAFDYTKWIDNKREENPLVIVNSILIDGSRCNEDVIVPDSVNSIGSGAFCGCDNLASITIPTTVTSVGISAFEYCDNLKDVYYSGTEEEWNKIDINNNHSYNYDDNKDYSNAPLMNANIHFGENPEETTEPTTSTSEAETKIAVEEPTTENKSLGDVNGDGVINSKDSVLMLKFYAESLIGNITTTSILVEKGDVNGDGKIDSKDAVIILKKYAERLISDGSNNISNDSAKTSINIGTVNIKPGTATVSIPVKISGNAGFAGGGIVFNYDSNLSFDGIESGIVGTLVKHIGNNSVAVTFASSNDVVRNEVMFTLQFKLSDDAKKGGLFKINGSIDTFCNSDTKDVSVKIVNGIVNVVGNTTTTTTTTTTISTKSIGDLNGDKSIDSKDVIVLKSYAESLVSSNATVDLAGDINGDKKVDSKDAVIILKYYAATLTGSAKSISEFV